MSINIPKRLCDISESIVATLDLSRLGPRQQAALSRSIRTGVALESSLPVGIARHILRQHSMPFVYLPYRRSVQWSNVGTGEYHFWGQMHTLLATMELGDPVRYDRDAVMILRAAVADRLPDFSEWLWIKANYAVLKHVKFNKVMPKDYVLPERLQYDVLKGERV